MLSLKAGGTGLNLTAASHVVLYDRWWNPRSRTRRDRAWRIGQTRTVVSHRLVCPGTVDERVEEVVAGKRHIADLVLPKSSSLADLDADQLRRPRHPSRRRLDRRSAPDRRGVSPMSQPRRRKPQGRQGPELRTPAGNGATSGAVRSLRPSRLRSSARPTTRRR